MFSSYFQALVLFYLITLFSPNDLLAQKDTLDSTRFTYHRVITYEGAETTVNANYFYMIEEMVEFLKSHPEYHLHIRGHVCCGPNMRISKKRAKTVYQIFLSYGVEEKQISYKGYSDTAPVIFPEKKPEHEQANRRVDFIFCIP